MASTLLSRVHNYKNKYPDKHFKLLVSGKRVAIVGPAGYLIGQDKGKFIDSHDLVVRHNSVICHYPFSAEKAKHFGSKLDILYMAPPRVSDPGLIAKAKNANIKFFRGRSFVSKKYSAFLDIERHLRRRRIPCQRADYTRLLLHGKEISMSPTTGLLSIVDVLLAGASSIYVTGFTFYHGGSHLFRNISGDLSPKCSNHNQTDEIRLVMALKEAFPKKIQVDEELINIYESLD